MLASKPLVTIILDDENKTEYAFPEPAAYSGTTTTMVDSGTSVSGKLLGSVVRESLSSISLSWRYLTTKQWAYINSLFKAEGENGARFSNTVRFFDQAAGEWLEREMYVNDRSAGMWRRDGDGDVTGWTDCSLELTEV